MTSLVKPSHPAGVWGLTALLTCLPLTVAADDLGAFVGFWAAADQSCENAIEISAAAIATGSSYCEIIGRDLDTALGTVRLDLACHHEGDVYRQPVLLIAGDNRDSMWRFYGGSALIGMSRCPDRAEQ